MACDKTLKTSYLARLVRISQQTPIEQQVLKIIV